MITLRVNFSPEYPVGMSRVGHYHRQHNAGANKHEPLAGSRRSRVPDRDASRNDIRKHADAKADVTQSEQAECYQEWPPFTPHAQCNKESNRRFCSRKKPISMILPSSRALAILTWPSICGRCSSPLSGRGLLRPRAEYLMQHQCRFQLGGLFRSRTASGIRLSPPPARSSTSCLATENLKLQ